MNVQEYLYTCLAEECSEVAQAVSKALRFGRIGIATVKRPYRNDRYIAHELNDVAVVVEILREEGFLPELTAEDLASRKADKRARIMKFLEEAKIAGRVTA